MVARNVNGLLENVAELRNDLLADRKDLKSDFKALDAKLFKLQNEVEKLARGHANFMEEMTSVAFDTNLEVRGALNSIEAIWDTMAEIVPGSEAAVAEKKRAAQEREERRVAAIDAKLEELAESARKKQDKR
jgi:prefoldin subunit 5